MQQHPKDQICRYIPPFSLYAVIEVFSPAKSLITLLRRNQRLTRKFFQIHKTYGQLGKGDEHYRLHVLKRCWILNSCYSTIGQCKQHPGSANYSPLNIKNIRNHRLCTVQIRRTHKFETSMDFYHAPVWLSEDNGSACYITQFSLTSSLPSVTSEGLKC